jgi:hypothetical protein
MYCQYCGQQLPPNTSTVGLTHSCSNNPDGVWYIISSGFAKKTWWKAKYGAEYYYITSLGEPIVYINGIETSHAVDISRHENHNYFQTKNDAKLHIKYVKLTMEAMANSDGKYTILADGKVEFDQKYPASLRFDSDSEAEDFVRLRKEYIAMLRRHFR